MDSFDVIVVGGGAAGLMCAAVAGARGRRVIVLEGSNRIGKKILMSGGGRCNFTNLNSSPANFISRNPHFCKSALSRYTPFDFLELVERHGIPYHEKTAGQLFCDRSSKDIVALLEAECAAAGVSIVSHRPVGSVEAEGHGGLYVVRCGDAEYRGAAVVVASGGLSIPKMGASDFGYRLARQFGLRVIDTRAGLVPFTFSGALHDLCARLAGVSCACEIRSDGVSFADELLFTHRGLSGPAVLQLSSYWFPGKDLEIDLLPGVDAAALLLDWKAAQPRIRLRTALAERLPRALVLELQPLWWVDLAETPLAEWANDRLQAIGARLRHWTLRPSGTEGYRSAEVTLGGVDTDELSSKTMESRQHPGLYFIGEVVDVTGHLGGHNFQWAWASAQAAGGAA